jgi:hypothetical protein
MCFLRLEYNVPQLYKSTDNIYISFDIFMTIMTAVIRVLTTCSLRRMPTFRINIDLIWFISPTHP